MAAGYTSSRSAALAAGWPESTYRAHEGGARTIDPSDAERYSRYFQLNGAKGYSGKWIVYGDDDDLGDVSLDDLLHGESAALRREAIKAIMALKKHR
jgi:hypothetical protein